MTRKKNPDNTRFNVHLSRYRYYLSSRYFWFGCTKYVNLRRACFKANVGGIVKNTHNKAMEASNKEFGELGYS